MKKLLSMSAVALLLLAGCGSSTVSYTGQSAADEDGNYYTISYDKTGDDITNVQIDGYLAEGQSYTVTSKKEADANGEYGMKEKTGVSWTEQVEMVEKAIEDNDAFPAVDAEGYDADGVTGATIHVNGFEEAFNAAVEA